MIFLIVIYYNFGWVIRRKKTEIKKEIRKSIKGRVEKKVRTAEIKRKRSQIGNIHPPPMIHQANHHTNQGLALEPRRIKTKTNKKNKRKKKNQNLLIHHLVSQPKLQPLLSTQSRHYLVSKVHLEQIL